MAKRTKKRSADKPTPKEVRRRRKSRQQNRKFLLAGGAVIALIVAILVYGYYRENIAAARAPVAVVNGEAIPTQEYQQTVRYDRFNLISSLGGQVDPQMLQDYLQNQLPQATLDTMINQVFIEQKAAEEGITVTDEEVQTAIEQQFGFTGDAAMPTEPAQEGVTTTQSAGSITREQFNQAFDNFLAALEAQGVTESEYREILRGELLREKVREQVVSDVATSGPQAHVRHILVETEEEAQEVRQRLLDGEDFATVAEEASLDGLTADNGGDLGWIMRGERDPAIDQAAFELPVGEISEPIQSQQGWHVVEVLEREEDREFTLDQLQQRRQDRFNQWLQEQRASADIQRQWSPDVVPPMPTAPASSQPLAPQAPAVPTQ